MKKKCELCDQTGRFDLPEPRLIRVPLLPHWWKSRYWGRSGKAQKFVCWRCFMIAMAFHVVDTRPQEAAIGAVRESRDLLRRHYGVSVDAFDRQLQKMLDERDRVASQQEATDE